MYNTPALSPTFFQHYWIWIAACAVVIAAAVIILVIRMRNKKRAGNRENDPYIEGLNYIIAGNRTGAARSFTKAIRDNTGNLDAYLKLGILYRQSDKADKAAQIHRELTIRSNLPKSRLSQVYRELAQDFEHIGKYSTALKYIESAREAEPMDIGNYWIKLRILEKLQRWDEAVQVHKELTSLAESTDHDREAQLHIKWGKKLDTDEQGHEGRLRYKKALKIKPGSVEARLALAESYILEDRLDDAMEWLQDIVANYTSQADKALPVLEKLLYEQGRFSEIEAILKNASQKEPGNVALMVSLVDILEKKGSYEEASQVCDRVLEENPTNTALLLRRLRIMKRFWDEGVFDRELDRIIQIDKDSGKV